MFSYSRNVRSFVLFFTTSFSIFSFINSSFSAIVIRSQVAFSVNISSPIVLKTRSFLLFISLSFSFSCAVWQRFISSSSPFPRFFIDVCSLCRLRRRPNNVVAKRAKSNYSTIIMPLFSPISSLPSFTANYRGICLSQQLRRR